LYWRKWQDSWQMSCIWKIKEEGGFTGLCITSEFMNCRWQPRRKRTEHSLLAAGSFIESHIFTVKIKDCLVSSYYKASCHHIQGGGLYDVMAVKKLIWIILLSLKRSDKEKLWLFGALRFMHDGRWVMVCHSERSRATRLQDCDIFDLNLTALIMHHMCFLQCSNTVHKPTNLCISLEIIRSFKLSISTLSDAWGQVFHI
jgi:hypothetical protein